MIFFLILFLILISYFLWAVIHELSHYLLAKYIANVKLVKFDFIPKVVDKTIIWASVQWQLTNIVPTRKQYALIFLAPRFFDLISVFLISVLFQADINNILFAVLTILIGGGLIDLINGSIGYSEYSDLRRASYALQISPWLLRITGFSIALFVITLWMFTSSQKFVAVIASLV